MGLPYADDDGGRVPARWHRHSHTHFYYNDFYFYGEWWNLHDCIRAPMWRVCVEIVVVGAKPPKHPATWCIASALFISHLFEYRFSHFWVSFCFYALVHSSNANPFVTHSPTSVTAALLILLTRSAMTQIEPLPNNRIDNSSDQRKYWRFPKPKSAQSRLMSLVCVPCAIRQLLSTDRRRQQRRY